MRFRYLVFLLFAVMVWLAGCNNQPLASQQASSIPATSHPTVSSSFLTEEAKYNVSHKAEPFTPTPHPLPSPTSAAAVVATTQGTNLQVVEGESGYPGSPRYQVAFAPQVWSLVDSRLQHQTIDDCALQLHTIAGEESGSVQRSKAHLGGYLWEVRNFLDAGVISYYTSTDKGEAFLFMMTYPKKMASDTNNPCQAAGEVVLNTFKLLSLPRYDATYYSFAYPNDWQVEENKKSNYIVLYPVAGQAHDNKIEFAYLGFEIRPEDNLLDWYNRYTQAGGVVVPERQIIEENVVELPNGVRSRRLHEQHVSGSTVVQTVLIEYGNLVLSINAYAGNQDMTERLKKIAASLEFHLDAPKTLAELQSIRN